MNVKDLKKHVKELNKHLAEAIDLAQDEEDLLEAFITSLSEVQDEKPEVINDLSEDLIEFYNQMIADMFSEEGEDETEEEGEDETEEEGEEESEEEFEPEAEEKPAKKAPKPKAEEPKKGGKFQKKEKEKPAKEPKEPKEPKAKKEKPVKEPKEPKPPREKKSGRKTWLTEEHLAAGGTTKERFGKIKPFYSPHKGSGSNFGKEEQPKDALGSVLGSGTASINEILLGKGGTPAEIAEKLGTKEGRVKNHIYALRRSGIEFEVTKGKYRVANIPADYHKVA